MKKEHTISNWQCVKADIKKDKDRFYLDWYGTCGDFLLHIPWLSLDLNNVNTVSEDHLRKIRVSTVDLQTTSNESKECLVEVIKDDRHTFPLSKDKRRVDKYFNKCRTRPGRKDKRTSGEKRG